MRLALVGPIRVASLLPWIDGGDDPSPTWPKGRGGTAVTQLAMSLLHQGHELLIVSLDDQVASEAVLQGPSLRIRLGPFRTRRRGRDAFRTERAYIRDALRREAPDVVHAHWTYEYAMGALASGLPTLVTVRDWAPTVARLNPDVYRLLRLAMSISVIARAEQFTVTSPYMQARLRRWTRKPIVVVPNALDDEAFLDEPVRAGRLGGEDPVIGAVNITFGRRKNVTTLLEAFAAIRDTLPGARLRLAGEAYGLDGPAHRWATARGLETGVEFVGPLPHEQVMPFMREAHLFVHPALEESFGLVLVEAMSQGVPVVAGKDSGAVPWVLDGGRAGMLTDVRSPARLAADVCRLLDDPERMTVLAKAGYHHAREHFRHSATLEQYLHIYQAVHAGHRVGAR